MNYGCIDATFSVDRRLRTFADFEVLAVLQEGWLK